MKSLSSVGLGLSVVFGCLFLALIAELYYLLWWKKRLTNREIEDDYSSPSKEVFYMFCWRRTSKSLSHMAQSPQQLCSSFRITDTLVHQPNAQLQLHMHTASNNDLLLKPFEEDELDAELMRLQSASGPPRHLFTIVEETKEDLESEDAKSRCGDKSQKGSRSKSLSDLLITVETPYLTPLGSPTLFTPPLTPVDSHNQHGFNFSSPLFESKSDAEFNRIRSSPPPKFKFLQEAEEKLRVKLKEQAEEGLQKNDGPVEEKESKASKASMSKFLKDEDQDGSYITIIIDKNKERELNHHLHHLQQHHSSTSQVLPLVSSPSAFRSSINKKPTLH
ncbi:uncharacterized protein LOC133714604 [Rosa rugosa]|uniref:uncharacterized protein LOC133714604 n=1 Tax=Rosa rugosa TaxID=74645 RepID=UPI002B408B1A|nr:uncharacterized protein LOC133714604 [Rosa rugosa]